MAASSPPSGATPHPPTEDKSPEGDKKPEKGDAKPPEPRLDIEKPLWDLNTFGGRFRHYLWITDCRTVLESNETLDKAKELYYQYKDGQEPEGTTREQILYAKKLFESSFHPDTHEKQNVFGRMSFQVPGNSILSGIMLTFYKSTPAVVFWQWFNQSFNALVNYTNRNANAPITDTQLFVAYVSATTIAVAVATILKSALCRANPVIQRYVPMAAITAANCVNAPLMRQSEILNGIDLNDENGNPVNIKSKIAPIKGISEVVISRIAMSAPGSLLIPLLMEKCWMKRLKLLHMPIQVLLMGAFLIFSTPMGCALFPQNCSIRSSTVEKYEPKEFAKLKKAFGKKIPE
ncbi:sideroflexin-2-like, partial [Chrysoperla carnea]|uniref:sideroflexin-2-like n=1 Tax=Chrysoperla carnea TaxID=189513 RepID=UPI001D0974C8